MSKKFKNLKTGLIEVVQNKLVIEQYEKHTDVYEKMIDNNEPTVAQLKEQATTLGLEFAKNIKKDELLALIEQASK